MLQETGIDPAELLLSQEDYDATVRELEALRVAYRSNLAEVEDVTIDALRIAHLERLLAAATVVATAERPGVAGLGSVVRVRRNARSECEYTLVGRRAADAPPSHVTPASPVGRALLGARRGDVVDVSLPSGRDHRLEVLDVRSSTAR
jgi:transcription elongation GreA/GreB family factor